MILVLHLLASFPFSLDDGNNGGPSKQLLAVAESAAAAATSASASAPSPAQLLVQISLMQIHDSLLLLLSISYPPCNAIKSTRVCNK